MCVYIYIICNYIHNSLWFGSVLNWPAPNLNQIFRFRFSLFLFRFFFGSGFYGSVRIGSVRLVDFRIGGNTPSKCVFFGLHGNLKSDFTKYFKIILTSYSNDNIFLFLIINEVGVLSDQYKVQSNKRVNSPFSH